MKEIDYSELEQTAFLREEDRNLYMEWLMEKLNALSSRLQAADIPSELTLDGSGMPGVCIHLGEKKEVVATFLQPEEDEGEMMMRLTSMMLKTGQTEPSEVTWTFFAGKVPEKPEALMQVIRIFGNPDRWERFPDGYLPGESADPGKAPEYTEELYRVLPKINALSGVIASLELVEDMAVTDGEKPCILLVGDEDAASLCYEAVPGAEDLFLLHLRADISYSEKKTGMSAGAYCDAFNEENTLIHASVILETEEDEFFREEGAETYISFHACIPEYGGFLTEAAYEALIAELFGCCTIVATSVL